MRRRSELSGQSTLPDFGEVRLTGNLPHAGLAVAVHLAQHPRCQRRHHHNYAGSIGLVLRSTWTGVDRHPVLRTAENGAEGQVWRGHAR
jgi:hypothetical protein